MLNPPAPHLSPTGGAFQQPNVAVAEDQVFACGSRRMRERWPRVRWPERRGRMRDRWARAQWSERRGRLRGDERLDRIAWG